MYRQPISIIAGYDTARTTNQHKVVESVVEGAAFARECVAQAMQQAWSKQPENVRAITIIFHDVKND